MEYDYASIKRIFKAKCLVETRMHEVGKNYKVETFVKPNSLIYVFDKNDYQYEIFESFYTFQLKFKII